MDHTELRRMTTGMREALTSIAPKDYLPVTMAFCVSVAVAHSLSREEVLALVADSYDLLVSTQARKAGRSA